MTTQTTNTQTAVTLDTSVKGLFESLFENTVLLDGNSNHKPLKESANATIMSILGANFLRVVERVPAYLALNCAYTSTSTKKLTGDYLPAIFLPTNNTQLFAGAIMFAAGLTMEQLSTPTESLSLPSLGFNMEHFNYLKANELDGDHAWLDDLYHGIRCIDWDTPEENTAFFNLND